MRRDTGEKKRKRDRRICRQFTQIINYNLNPRINGKHLCQNNGIMENINVKIMEWDRVILIFFAEHLKPPVVKQIQVSNGLIG